jgi:hypothetical protein
MSEQSPREILKQADQERAKARGAESVMLNFRLGCAPVVHRKSGLLGWRRDRSTAPDPKDFETVDRAICDALYEALRIVKRDAERRAAALEASVQRVGDAS